MKKFLLGIVTMAAMTFAAQAATVTYNCSDLGGADVNPLSELKVGEVTFTFEKAGGNNAPAYYKSGSDIRLYAKNTMTVTAAEGYKVEKLMFTYTKGWNQIGRVTASLGTAEQTEEGLTWTGDASKFMFTVSDKAELGADPSKAGQFRFTSVEVTYAEGEGEKDPGADTPDTPDPKDVITVAQALEFIASDNIPAGKVQVRGIISEITEISAQYGNGTFTVKDALTDAQGLVIFRCKWIGGASFAGGEVAVGGTVVVEGTLVDYNGTPEMTTGGVVISYEGPAGDGPDEPVTPDPEGVITVAQALQYITSNNIPAGKVQVKGIISEITEISAQYGNGTFTVKDALTDAKGLVIFRCKWIGGASFAGGEVAVGGTVVVEGTLVDYNGTPEMTTGGVVISYEKPAGDVPEPDQPEVPTGDYVTFNFADIAGLSPSFDPEAVVDGKPVGEYDVTDVTFQSGIITIEGTAEESASTKPRLYKSTAGAWTYRFYKDNTITIAVDDSDYVITGIVFNATYLGTESVVFTNGTFADNIFTPAGDSGVEYMTITKTATGSNPTISSIQVYYASKAGVESIEADVNAPVEYFNLQGVRVDAPENGLFIRRQGNTVSKVLVK